MFDLESVSALISPNLAIFGNSIAQYTYFFATILIFIMLSKAVYFVFKHYVRKITEKTETDLDDLLVGIVEHPITFFVLIVGIYAGNILFLSPDTYVHELIGNIVKMLIIINVAWLALRIIDTLVVHYIKPYAEKSETELDDQLLPILRKGLKLIIVVLTLLFILANFGYDVTTLLAGLGVGGLAVALAAQDTIGNFISSVIIFTDKPFRVRDFIKFGNFSGTVKEVGIRSTKIQTLGGTVLVVPNSKISNEIVENFTQAETRMLEQVIGITYDTGYKKVDRAVKLLEKIALSHKNVGNCDVKFVEFASHSLNISFRYWLKDKTLFRQTMHEINMSIKKEFDREKIEMAFPTQTVYLKK